MAGNVPAPHPSSSRRPRPKLRQATLILPKTGERIKKTFTLRNSISRPYSDSALPDGDNSPLRRTRSSTYAFRKPSVTSLEHIKLIWGGLVAFWTSTTGVGILKCSLAYVLGSLATFVPVVSGWLGQNDGKHMVATVCVYFHPARSAGSMIEAIFWAGIAFLYAAAVSFSSMAVSVFFGSQDLLRLGHVIVLVIFCGGGLGFVGWIKQKLGNPLVNVGCSLTSLALITVLTKEGAVQAGNFSYNKVLQVLKMVAMGVVVSTAVNMLVKPQSARKSIRKDFEKITDLQEEMLTAITRSFLSGAESDLKGAPYTSLMSSYRSTFNAMVKNLREAKFEHYIVGAESIHKAEKRLVQCIERLGQSLNGLRSAAETQFDLLRRPNYGTTTPVAWRLDSVSGSPTAAPSDHKTLGLPGAASANAFGASLGPITEEPEGVDFRHKDGDTSSLNGIMSEPQTSTGPSDIFAMFISSLGPAMKSLAFTLQGVLTELPYTPGSDNSEQTITVNSTFRRSLTDAKHLFEEAREKALRSLYRTRNLEKSPTPEIAADYEEVAASCGQFSSSLLDFAEDTIAYLDILEELDTEIEENRRSWKWLRFWRKWWGDKSNDQTVLGFREESAARRMSQSFPTPKLDRIDRRDTVGDQSPRSSVYRHLWRALAIFRAEDARFALKVGIGAVIYASFSFIPETQPIYAHWRGEWGLLSYMLVCSMTIGASNTTGLQRIFGTCLGAALATIAWLLCRENAFILGFFGWVVSLFCFWIMVGRGQGPMGRFIMLTYNLSALYAYSLSMRDGEDDDDEGGNTPEIWEIILHRVVAVLGGCLWGMIVTRVVYPISARKKLRQGVSILWLRMGLIWKRDPLSILVDKAEDNNQYMDIRESTELQRLLGHLEGLRESASHEFELRGPFPNDLYKKILEATRHMIGSFIVMNTVIQKDLKASPGEAELLQYTQEERKALSLRVSHLFSVLASSMQMAYPIIDAVPSVERLRDRFLTKLFEFRKQGPGRDMVEDVDYELLYAYALVTGQIAKEIQEIGTMLEQLYGVLDEESLRLR